MHSAMRALLVAALLAGAALPGGHAYSPLKKAIFPQQPTYKQSPLLVGDSDYQYQTAEAQTAGILWHGTPKPLTPTNFTVMFPDLSSDLSSNDRIEVHLPGFGGAYNAFGAKHPDSTALAGAFHPLQNGVSMYSREHCYKIDFTKQAFLKATNVGVSNANANTNNELELLAAQDLTDLDPMVGDYVRLRDGGTPAAAMEYARITDINEATTKLTVERNVHPPCLDGQSVGAALNNAADEVLLVTGAAHQQCIQTVEWDPNREVLRVTVESNVATSTAGRMSSGAATKTTKCRASFFNGITIDEAYLRQYYQRDGLPSGKGPLPPATGLDRDWYRKAWVRRYSSASCASGGANAQRPGLGKETCDVTKAIEYKFNRDLSTNMQFESNMEYAVYSAQTKGAVGTTVKPSFSWLAASGSKTGISSENCISVTIVPTVTMVSTVATAQTDITLVGITGSSTHDTDSLAVFPGAGCKWQGGAPTMADVNDNTNSIRAYPSETNGVDVFMSPGGKPWTGKWTKGPGNLEFRIGTGFSIAAGEAFTFSFKLDNGDLPQKGKEVYISAMGHYCSENLCDDNSDPDFMIDPPQKFDVSKTVVEVSAPTFDVAKLHQSTSDPDATATITVSLLPNRDLSTSDAELTMTGLCGSTLNDEVQILDVFGSPIDRYSTPSTLNFARMASWNRDTKVFKVKLGSKGLITDTMYVFKFKWKLLKTENAACDVMIAASGQAAFAPTKMTGSIGKVEKPAFTTFKIGQVSTRPDAINYVCVTLETNYRFNSQTTGKQEQSKFTLTGLTGSQHVDEQGVSVYPCPGNELNRGMNEFALNTKNGWAMPISQNDPTALTGTAAPFKPLTASRTATTFDFTAAAGQAEFVMDTTGFKAGTEYVFAIKMQNSKTAQECKTVTLTADGDIEQTVTMEQPTYRRALVDGETDGDACALKVYDPGFLTKTIASSRVLAKETTTLTVTLRSNKDLLSTVDGFYSSITISGLTGSKTGDSDSLTLLKGGLSEKGNVKTAFTPEVTSLKWVQSSGTLSLVLATSATCVLPGGAEAKRKLVNCVKAGVEYVLQFELTNGDTVQSAPAVSVTAEYESGKFFPKKDMDGPLSPGATKAKAMEIVDDKHFMAKYKIGQLVATPGARNSLCVTLASRTDLTSTTNTGARRFVAFTITGLTGFKTDTQDLSMLYTDGQLVMGPTVAGGFERSGVKNYTLIGGINGLAAGGTAAAKQGADEVAQYDVLELAGLEYEVSAVAGNGVTLKSPIVTGAAADKLAGTVTRRSPTQSATWNMFCESEPTATGCKTGENNMVKFDDTKGEAKFFLGTMTMTAGKDYKFCFHVTNPDKSMACRDVSIKYRDSGVGSEVAFAMKKDSGTRCPGATDERMFTTATIRSSSNVTSYKTGIFLELVPNYKVGAAGIITISGLKGFTAAQVSAQAADVAIDVVKNGVRDTATFNSDAKWDGSDKLTLTLKSGVSMAARDAFSSSGTAEFDKTPLEDDLYVIYFKLYNPAQEQVAGTITVDVGTDAKWKKGGVVESGLVKTSRRALSADALRRADGDLVFKFTPQAPMHGGESLILELPHYSVDVEGPVFGITSSHAAFTTYADRSEWELNGIDESRARALFTNGYVADGKKASKRSGVDSGLDGFFMLATGDDGLAYNKFNWFSESSLWEGTIKVEITAFANSDAAAGAVVDKSEGLKYHSDNFMYAHNDPADAVAETAVNAAKGIYGISSTTAKLGSASTTAPTSREIPANALVGARLTCSKQVANTAAKNTIFGTSTYMTESMYILQNHWSQAGVHTIVTEDRFDDAMHGSAHPVVDESEINAQCRIEHKRAVSTYTGMTVMFDNGKEFKIMQGAGALYQLSDGSGVPPSAHDIEGRAYTIYSQLEITLSKGKSVAAGETVTITIPKSTGIIAPKDLSAPVVARQADGDKCTRRLEPITGDLAMNSGTLGSANLMSATRDCNYEGMPSEDFSIAAKSTVRRVFASVLGVSSTDVAMVGGQITRGLKNANADNADPSLLDVNVDLVDAVIDDSSGEGLHLCPYEVEVVGNVHVKDGAANVLGAALTDSSVTLQHADKVRIQVGDFIGFGADAANREYMKVVRLAGSAVNKEVVVTVARKMNPPCLLGTTIGAATDGDNDADDTLYVVRFKDLKSTATLGGVWPFKYDAGETGPVLKGKPLTVYGALSVQAEITVSGNRGGVGVAFANALTLVNNDATATNNAADVVQAGDSLNILGVVYNVKSVTTATTFELDRPYAGVGAAVNGVIRSASVSITDSEYFVDAATGVHAARVHDKMYAGQSMVFGVEDYGMSMPMDISRLQRVIAVQDATGIAVGDYLSVGAEMMHVLSVDGNYIGVERGAAGTIATSHRALPNDEYFASAAVLDGDGADALEVPDPGGVASDFEETLEKAYDAVPASGWVTIWKRDTSVKSFYLTADSGPKDHDIVNANQQQFTLNEAATSLSVLGAAEATWAGKIVLVGGTTDKEFFAIEAVAGNVVTTVDRDLCSNAAIWTRAERATRTCAKYPFISRAQNVRHKGDSLVQYTCDFGGQNYAATTATAAASTQGGVANRVNRCKQTTLLGLTVIPVEKVSNKFPANTGDTYMIEPGDYLRIDYPYSANSDEIVQANEEEIYRVNGVDGNDLIVTPKPLAHSAAAAVRVQRYPGGTVLDLIKQKRASGGKTPLLLSYSRADAIPDTNADHTVTVDSVNGVDQGDYCLIDQEFFWIEAINTNTKVLTFNQVGIPATNTQAGNQGRAAFGTTRTTHPREGSCYVFKYLDNSQGEDQIQNVLTDGGAAQAAPAAHCGTTANGRCQNGFTRIFDPKTSIRHVVNAVDADADAAIDSLALADKAAIKHRTISEPANIIGDPLENDGAMNPVRGGTDFNTGGWAVGDGTLDLTAANSDDGVTNIGTTTGPYGFDYQIDSGRLHPGTSYLVGALGDMLEDVSRFAPLNDLQQCYYRVADAKTAVTMTLHGAGDTNSDLHLTNKMLVDNYVGQARVGDLLYLETAAEYMLVTAIDTRYETDGFGVMAGNDVDKEVEFTVLRGVVPPISADCLGIPTVPKIPTDEDSGALKVWVLPRNIDVDMDILGDAGSTTRFADPWGAGSNVTEFCHTVNPQRKTTLSTALTAFTVAGSQTATAVLAETAVRVASLSELGVRVGDFIRVGSKTAAAQPATGDGIIGGIGALDGGNSYGEFMLVQKINYATSTLTVIRAATPPCHRASGIGFDHEVGSEIYLVTPDYSTVNMADAIAKTGGQGADEMISTSMRAIVELSPKERIVWVPATPTPQPPVPAPPAAKKKSSDNLLLLLLLLLLIPIAAAVWWCCKKEPVNQPVAKPMAPVYLPQNYPVLEMSPNPAQMAPMPPYGM